MHSDSLGFLTKEFFNILLMQWTLRNPGYHLPGSGPAGQKLRSHAYTTSGPFDQLF